MLDLKMLRDLFPRRDGEHVLKVNTITVLARSANAGNYDVTLTPPLAGPAPGNTLTLLKTSQYGGLHLDQKDVSGAGVLLDPAAPVSTWQLAMAPAGGGPLDVEDVLVVLGYEWDS